MKGEKSDRQTAKQSCQPLGKLKITKREEEKEEKKQQKETKNKKTKKNTQKKKVKFIIIVKWNKINDRMIEIK